MHRHQALTILLAWSLTATVMPAEGGSLSVQCEIIQSVQDVSRSVPLLCGKPTYARLYLSWTGETPITLRGEIARTDTRGMTTTIQSSANLTVPPIARSLTVQRNDVQKSLNFDLGEPLVGGQAIEVTKLIDVASNEPVEFDASACPKNHTFFRAPPLRLRLLGIRFPYNEAGATIAPSADDYALADSWLERTYPVADVVTEPETVDANFDWPFTCEDVNAQLETIREDEIELGGDPRVRYYGMVSALAGHYMRGCATGIPAGPDAAIVASGPTNISIWGYWDDDGSIGDWYAGHELGHMLGRSHVGACGEGTDYLDTTYPIAGAALGDAQRPYVGFDTGDDNHAGVATEALPGTSWHDVMSYCDYQWVSAHTFMGLFAHLVAAEDEPTGEFKPAGQAPGTGDCPAFDFVDQPVTALGATVDPGNAPFEVQSGQFISVTAKVDLDAQTATIVSLKPRTRGIVSPRVFRSDSGLPSLEVHQLDSTGTILDEYPVRVLPSTNRTIWQPRTALVSALIPLDPATAVVELRYDGALADTRQASRVPPQVADVRVEQQEGPGGEAVLRWQSSDADSNDGELIHTVLVSSDNGQTFRTIASGTRRREIQIDVARYARQRVTFRVIASDGFLLGEADSDPTLIR